MIGYMKKLNRFYDTKKKKIVSSKAAFDWALNHHMHHVPVVHPLHSVRRTESNRRVGRIRHTGSKSKHSRKSIRTASYSRPSYKALYENASKRLQKSTVQLHKLEEQYSASNYHPFLAHRTKDGDVSPEKNIRDVRNWMKHHTGKLFVIAALDKNDQYDVEACGSVDDLKAAGFAARDLVPSLIEKFSSGYND